MAFVKRQSLACGKCYINACSLNKLKSGRWGSMQTTTLQEAFWGFCVSDVGQYGSFWGISSPVLSARRDLMTHSPCSAKQEFVEPDPSRSPVRTRAVERSPLLQPRWPTPDKSGTVSVARREAPPPEPQSCCWFRSWAGCVGLQEGSGFACTPFLLPPRPVS